MVKVLSLEKGNNSEPPPTTQNSAAFSVRITVSGFNQAKIIIRHVDVFTTNADIFSYFALKTFVVMLIGNASMKNCHSDILLTNHSEKCIQIIFLITQCDLAGIQQKYLLIPRSTTPYEPRHEISNNVVCATIKGSDQPAHDLIRVFASHLNIL